jgi:hypothetical protein
LSNFSPIAKDQFPPIGLWRVSGAKLMLAARAADGDCVP